MVGMRSAQCIFEIVVENDLKVHVSVFISCNNFSKKRQIFLLHDTRAIYLVHYTSFYIIMPIDLYCGDYTIIKGVLPASVLPVAACCCTSCVFIIVQQTCFFLMLCQNCRK